MHSSEQARGAFLQQTGDPFAARASSDAGAGTRGADDETAFATSLNRITGKRTNGERLPRPPYRVRVRPVFHSKSRPQHCDGNALTPPHQKFSAAQCEGVG